MHTSVSKGSLRDSKNFSKPHLLKTYHAGSKYKPKKSSDSTSSRTGTVKYTASYSSKRPKSAKSVGNYINASKYRRQEQHPSSSIYKSYKGDSTNQSKGHGTSKVTVISKYDIKPKKVKSKYPKKVSFWITIIVIFGLFLYWVQNNQPVKLLYHLFYQLNT